MQCERDKRPAKYQSARCMKVDVETRENCSSVSQRLWIQTEALYTLNGNLSVSFYHRAGLLYATTKHTALKLQKLSDL
jgi:hypothetical protein